MSDPVAEALFGKARRAILSLLFGRPEERFYMRQIARLTGISTAAAQYELKRLATAELVTRDREGKQVYYQANASSPVFAEIQGLMAKTLGALAVVRNELSDLAAGGRIDVAFIYGSFATGAQASASDVDLMVIGDASLSELIPGLRAAQDQIGREINPTAYPKVEFQERLKAGEHFISRVLERPKVMLIGTEDELEELAGESLAG
jgi:DNA-binding transcriptional ArsR family regulator